MTSQHSTLAALTLGLLTAACSTTSSSMETDDTGMSTEAMSQRVAYEPTGDVYTMVVMRVNDGMHVPSRDELAELTTGHNEFMQSMTENGYLLAQGPVIPSRSSVGLRGIYFVDSCDPFAAYDRVCNDPAAESGIYGMETMTFITETNMRGLAPEQSAEQMTNPGAPSLRPYVAVFAPSSAAMTAKLDQMGDVILFYGHCTTGEMENMTVCFIDANTVDEARQIMSVTGIEAEAFEYHTWVSSITPADMN